MLDIVIKYYTHLAGKRVIENKRMVIVKNHMVHPRNTLNNLPSNEWLKSTRTWFMLRPKGRDKKILHPASFPEELVANYIQFFTKENAMILDPFLGSGTTVVASRYTKRNAVGIELNKKYAELSNNRLDSIPSNDTKQFVINDDSKNLKKIAKKYGIPKCDFCITSPPYWNQLKNSMKKKSERATQRKKLNYDTDYGSDAKDLGMIDDYEQFLESQDEIFDQVFDLLKLKSYLVVITNNIYQNGRLWPLAFDTVTRLSKKYVPKDEQIWCQDNKKLYPFGMFHSYVGNRSHHYCLIFKKESL